MATSKKSIARGGASTSSTTKTNTTKTSGTVGIGKTLTKDATKTNTARTINTGDKTYDSVYNSSISHGATAEQARKNAEAVMKSKNEALALYTNKTKTSSSTTGAATGAVNLDNKSQAYSNAYTAAKKSGASETQARQVAANADKTSQGTSSTKSHTKEYYDVYNNAKRAGANEAQATQAAVAAEKRYNSTTKTNNTTTSSAKTNSTVYNNTYTAAKRSGASDAEAAKIASNAEKTATTTTNTSTSHTKAYYDVYNNAKRAGANEAQATQAALAAEKRNSSTTIKTNKTTGSTNTNSTVYNNTYTAAKRSGASDEEADKIAKNAETTATTTAGISTTHTKAYYDVYNNAKRAGANETQATQAALAAEKRNGGNTKTSSTTHSKDYYDVYNSAKRAGASDVEAAKAATSAEKRNNTTKSSTITGNSNITGDFGKNYSVLGTLNSQALSRLNSNSFVYNEQAIKQTKESLNSQITEAKGTLATLNNLINNSEPNSSEYKKYVSMYEQLEGTVKTSESLIGKFDNIGTSVIGANNSVINSVNTLNTDSLSMSSTKTTSGTSQSTSQKLKGKSADYIAVYNAAIRSGATEAQAINAANTAESAKKKSTTQSSNAAVDTIEADTKGKSKAYITAYTGALKSGATREQAIKAAEIAVNSANKKKNNTTKAGSDTIGAANSGNTVNTTNIHTVTKDNVCSTVSNSSYTSIDTINRLNKEYDPSIAASVNYDPALDKLTDEAIERAKQEAGPNATPAEIAYCAYNHIAETTTYSKSGGYSDKMSAKYNISDAGAWRATSVLDEDIAMGACQNYAAATAAIFRKLGFDAKVVGGIGAGDEHFWCQVGNYVFDADVDSNSSSGAGIGKRFGLTSSEIKAKGMSGYTPESSSGPNGSEAIGYNNF